MNIHFPIIPNKKKCLFLLKYFDYSLTPVPEKLSIFVHTEKKCSCLLPLLKNEGDLTSCLWC